MKKSILWIVCGLLAVTGCTGDGDNPASDQREIELKNFSNSGCKSNEDRTRSDDNAWKEVFNYGCIHEGYLYVTHQNAMFNCCAEVFGADVSVEGNQIRIGEYESYGAGEGCYCICPYDLSYEIGPLVEGKTYVIYIGHKGNESKVAEFEFHNSMSGVWGVETINAVCGGIIHEDFYPKEIDESDPLSVFFAAELHDTYWDIDSKEHSTFFYQEESGDCFMVIDSREAFLDAYMGTEELPNIDFDLYTLIIGRTWGSNSAYRLVDVVLKDMGPNLDLETKLIHYANGGAYEVILDMFYWCLYPKLPQKSISLRRTVTDIH